MATNAPKTAQKAAEKAPKVAETAPKTTQTDQILTQIESVADEIASKTPAEAPKAEKTAKYIKVKFLRSHPAFGYSAGDTGEIPADKYEKYSQDGPFFEKI